MDDPVLRRPGSFLARAEVLDRLDFLPASALSPETSARAGVLRAALDAADAALFHALRARLRAGLRGAALRDALETLVPPRARLALDAPGYDAFDVLLDGILLPGEAPAPSLPLMPDMVGLQQAPARVIVALAEEVGRASTTVFHDIGSGWGRVALLVGLLTGHPARGIERDPALCDHAAARAQNLGVPNVTFLTSDARDADLGGGPHDVYFLYTPFRGALLNEVLDRLHAQSARGARVFTYGPCSIECSRHAGFRRMRNGPITPDRLEVFRRLGD